MYLLSLFEAYTGYQGMTWENLTIEKKANNFAITGLELCFCALQFFTSVST